MIPGELLVENGELELNAGRPTLTVVVANTGDRPIQVGSHFHFADVNAALEFERDAAAGFRLAIVNSRDLHLGRSIRDELALAFWSTHTLGATANCTPWALFGGALPSRVDGHSANYREMLVAQQRTRDYINEVEQTIAHCKPDNHTHDSLVKSMELAHADPGSFRTVHLVLDVVPQEEPAWHSGHFRVTDGGEPVPVRIVS